MTQEEKELLLKDLCVRLPYGVKIYAPTEFIDCEEIRGVCVFTETVEVDCNTNIDVCKVKPYLRPISSMTDEEAMEYLGMLNDIDKSGLMNQNFITKVVDWLDKKMFDHRGLLPKGLALEATEGTYNN